MPFVIQSLFITAIKTTFEFAKRLFVLCLSHSIAFSILPFSSFLSLCFWSLFFVCFHFNVLTELSLSSSGFQSSYQQQREQHEQQQPVLGRPPKEVVPSEARHRVRRQSRDRRHRRNFGRRWRGHRNQIRFSDNQGKDSINHVTAKVFDSDIHIT